MANPLKQDEPQSTPEIGAPAVDFGQLSKYLRNLFAYARGKLLPAFVLVVAVGMTDGIKLFMLVPFLHLIGFPEGPGARSEIVTRAAEVFSRVGLPLSLGVVLSVFLALVTFRGVVARWRQLLLAEIEYGFVDHLRTRIYAAIGGANWEFLSRRRVSEFTHVLTTDIGRVSMGTTLFVQLVVTGVMVVVHVLVAVRLSGLVTAMALLCGTGLLLLLWPQVRRARDLGSRLTEANREVYGTVAGFLDGIKLAKSYGAERKHADAFGKAVTSLREQLLHFQRSSSIMQLTYQVGAAAALSSLLYFASALGDLPGPELLVLVFVFARLLPLLSDMQRNVQSLAFMIPAFRTAMTMEAECLAAAEPAPEQDGFNPSLRTAVELRNVGFSYAERGPQKALCDINLIIPARTTTALVGSTGAGKSTLADVLVGLLTPNEGQILVDGEPLTPQRSRRWRGVVAYVPQETFLFHDTIRSNLLWSRPEATAEEVYDALRMAAADSFVSGLPQGLDTIVGERGIRLSGGERQRLALARALLRRPSLLVLDEATSALDSEHELRIQQAIEELHGELTIVIIAHRLSTIRHADRIVVLERGRVVESGRWEELGADVDGRFHALLGAAGIDLA